MLLLRSSQYSCICCSTPMCLRMSASYLQICVSSYCAAVLKPKSFELSYFPEEDPGDLRINSSFSMWPLICLINLGVVTCASSDCSFFSCSSVNLLIYRLKVSSKGIKVPRKAIELSHLKAGTRVDCARLRSQARCPTAGCCWSRNLSQFEGPASIMPY